MAINGAPRHHPTVEGLILHHQLRTYAPVPFHLPISRSIPPLQWEFFVERAIQEAIHREAAAKERTRRRARNATRRWTQVLESWWKQNEEKAVHEICAEADSRASRITPQLRIVMHREAFNTFISYVFAERSDVPALEHLGIIRDIGGRTVEFWCADEVLEDNATMQTLHYEALICQSTLEQHQIRLAMAPLEPITVKFKSSLTLECVRKKVHKRFGVAPVKQRLTHRSRTLSRGILSEQGVGPGSVVHVTERCENLTSKKNILSLSVMDRFRN